MRGKIKWFEAERGYGFVAVENVGDALLHQDEVQDYERVKDKLIPGAIVEFFAVYRIRAKNARLVEDLPAQP